MVDCFIGGDVGASIDSRPKDDDNDNVPSAVAGDASSLSSLLVLIGDDDLANPRPDVCLLARREVFVVVSMLVRVCEEDITSGVMNADVVCSERRDRQESAWFSEGVSVSAPAVLDKIRYDVSRWYLEDGDTTVKSQECRSNLKGFNRKKQHSSFIFIPDYLKHKQIAMLKQAYAEYSLKLRAITIQKAFKGEHVGIKDHHKRQKQFKLNTSTSISQDKLGRSQY
eukprot:scaffold87016_cov54-Cyclotella_meneghiniana.AAC.5